MKSIVRKRSEKKNDSKTPSQTPCIFDFVLVERRTEILRKSSIVSIRDFKKTQQTTIRYQLIVVHSLYSTFVEL